MSNLVFPTLPGASIDVKRSPSWESNVQRSVSGRSIGITAFTYPLWKYRVSFEFLRADSVGELEEIVGFFNKHRGRTDTWLFLDEDDYLVANQQIGLGDGVTTSFQLVRSYGGFVEPITEPKQFDSVKVGGVEKSSAPRTNIFKHSTEADTNNGWFLGTNLTRIGKTTAPDGSNTATVYSTGSTGNAFVQQLVSLAANTTYTLSVWAKLISGSAPSAGALIISDHDIDGSGTITAGERTQLGWSGLDGTWRRFSLTFTNIAAVSAGQYLCTEFGNGAQIAIWGAQLETGTLATAFIPTSENPVTITDFSHAGGGRILFATPPAAGLAITWSGQFYRRCRFDDDALDTEKFLYRLWRAKSVDFTTEKG